MSITYEERKKKEQSLIIKIGFSVVGALGAIILALNSYTIVNEGDVKVQSLFGKVNQTEVLTAGFHPVNPLKSFDTYSIRNDKYEINGLNVPTQDRFNSTANVTVMYNIDGDLAPSIKTNYGTSNQYIDKTLRQQLRSIIRDEGRKLTDSRALAVSDNVSSMQQNTMVRLTEALDGTGITVHEVLVQDIEFDGRISKQILATQQRIQAEEAKKSEERQAVTDAEIKKQNAIGDANKKREEAAAESFRITELAKANKQSSIDRATGEAEAITLVADAQSEANRKLNASLTSSILRKQELDNEAILFSKSKGNVPTTVIGTDSGLKAYGVPMGVAK